MKPGPDHLLEFVNCGCKSGCDSNSDADVNAQTCNAQSCANAAMIVKTQL